MADLEEKVERCFRKLGKPRPVSPYDDAWEGIGDLLELMTDRIMDLYPKLPPNSSGASRPERKI
jgi:hypothetical protein